jgi:hypothetical protein
VKAEATLKAALEARGKGLQFYRHPYLAAGKTPEIRSSVRRFLSERGYRVAPVTLDPKDYQFTAPYANRFQKTRTAHGYLSHVESLVSFMEHRSTEVIGRSIPHILLIHANQMHADLMPDLLAAFCKRGYRFISLDQALSDPVYQAEDDAFDASFITWVEHQAQIRGIPVMPNPQPPPWIEEAAAESSPGRLRSRLGQSLRGRSK